MQCRLCLKTSPDLVTLCLRVDFCRAGGDDQVYGQEHVFRWRDELDPSQLERLQRQYDAYNNSPIYNFDEYEKMALQAKKRVLKPKLRGDGIQNISKTRFNIRAPAILPPCGHVEVMPS